MNRTAILVVGNNDLLHSSNQWEVITVVDTEAAIEKFQQAYFDVVVFTNDNGDAALKLSKLFLFQQPDIILLQNTNAALLSIEIENALQKKQAANKPSFSFTDDALKAAELPITIQ